MSQKATDCDYCPTEIPYGILAWMIHVGKDVDGKTPIIKICCTDCYDSGKTKA